ncbi:conserved hypothetical protein [Leishmania mexicana MHOM/GT/2001/U1103]|uniref:Uncharacterized protein n=1 Tax=Leishmania mexicana (strain MHOM/GT/2001/U1103) TaxID=929439 RepID=E9B4A8_LEIMU|nr:conserved hypothetical protein [Leishmania mexicana MHOM/GT/2001/U1103]CBZ30076.1 conserved hypothetical protein [Leishmania mexicana MHOM/GT/2001/U1103]
MSTYEWVIEQESPDGVTTRVVFDFADGNTVSHGNGGRANVSSSSYHLQHRRDGRGRGSTGGTPSAAGFFAFKEVTRSEEGSSRRSSKRSNGSRSRRQRHHRLGTSGKGSRESGIGTMAGTAGSAYTSTSLRQRYQRMLFGGGRGGRSTTVAGVSRTPTVPPDVSASVLASGLPLSYRIDPSAGLNDDTHSLSFNPLRGTTTGDQPPSTLFMSAYGAELVDEDEHQSSSGCLSRRNCCRTRRGSSSRDGGVSSVVCASVTCDLNAAAPQHAAGGMHNTGDTPRCSSVLIAAATTAAAAPPLSCYHRRVVAREESDEDFTSETGIVNGNGSCYVLRDVWATRASCPRTITTARAADFPAFPPLHPISVEKEEEPTETVTRCCGHPAGGTGARDGLSGIADAMSTQRASFSLATSQESICEEAKADAAEHHRRYNKMLLKKERQWRRDRGWQPTGSSEGCTFSFCRIDDWYAGEGSRGLRGGASAGPSRRGRRERPLGVRGRLDAYEPRSSSSTDSNEDDADDESCDTSSLSSLECLSTSSRGDFDVSQLRTDSVFAATVQSLASRAERERKKMEVREEQMLWCEAAQNKETSMAQRLPLHSPATFRGLMPSADGAASTTPASPPSLAIALRRGDAVSAGGLMRNGVGSGSACRSGAVSSFFISPIHQSVAAESAAWAAGTGFEFLGQGGLGGNDTTSSSLMPTSRPAPWQRRGSASAAARATVNRRRERSEDNEEGYAEELKDSCDGGASSSATRVIAADAQARTHRARKKRKRGDRARQSVVGECGGSRALRPVAAPSNGPPLEILPCSKVDMREDFLESFLMEAMLDEGDFALY